MFKKIREFFTKNLLKFEKLEEANIQTKIFWFFLFFVFLIAVQFVDKIIFYFLLPDVFNFEHYHFSIQTFITNYKTQIEPQLWFFIIVAVIEEIIFRLPISFFYKYDIVKRTCAIVILCFLFGFYHLIGYPSLNIVSGTYEVLLITSSALCFSAIYIIFGGSKRKILIPLLVAILLHFTADVFMLSLFGLPTYLK